MPVGSLVRSSSLPQDTQIQILRKESSESTAQTSIMPAAPLQYVSVIVLNRSWPAVSQICIFNLLLPTSTTFVLKSTPIVATWQSLKSPYSPFLEQKREIMLVLPTPVSPTMIIFTMQSQMSRYFALLISCSRSQRRLLSNFKPNSLFIFYRIQTTKNMPTEGIFYQLILYAKIAQLLLYIYQKRFIFIILDFYGEFLVRSLFVALCGCVLGIQLKKITDQKMQQSQAISSSASESKRSKNQQRIVIGYYNLRGKAQVCRLLCEYLGVDYKDRLFTLAEWQRFNAEKTKDWPFPSLPYLREGTFITTESVPMCVYVINRFGNPDLLGKSLRDRGLVEMYIWTIEYMGNVITINCQQKSAEELKRFKDEQWAQKVYPRLLKLQQAVLGEQWFLDYLTIIDFSIYELIRYMDCIFDNQTVSLPKLKRIETALGNLPSIKQYQQSSHAIVEWCPTKLLEGLKANAVKTATSN